MTFPVELDRALGGDGCGQECSHPDHRKAANVGGERQVCAVCGGDAGVTRGLKLPFCFECQREWDASLECARAATARPDFVERKRKERA